MYPWGSVTSPRAFASPRASQVERASVKRELTVSGESASVKRGLTSATCESASVKRGHWCHSAGPP